MATLLRYRLYKHNLPSWRLYYGIDCTNTTYFYDDSTTVYAVQTQPTLMATLLRYRLYKHNLLLWRLYYGMDCTTFMATLLRYGLYKHNLLLWRLYYGMDCTNTTYPHGDELLEKHDPGHEIDKAVMSCEQGRTVSRAQLKQRPEVRVQ